MTEGPRTSQEHEPDAVREPARTGRFAATRQRYRGLRDGMRHRPVVDRCWRWTVGTLGTIVVIAGLIMVPYPGPGWLIVFTGLAVLASEFEGARRVLTVARGHYDRWNAWQKRRHWTVRLALLAATGVVVLVTMWLLDVLGTGADQLGLDLPWLDSPLEPFA